MQPDRRLAIHDGCCVKCGTEQGLIRISEVGRAACPRCYPEVLRARIENTVRRFRMIPHCSAVTVAVSGGSDSAALLHALSLTRRRLNFSLSAMYIDMGLGEYSEQCLQAVQEQCAISHVQLHVDRVGDWGVDVAPIGDWPVCAVCGGIRRALMPRLAMRIHAQVLCTGHTLDDQLQFMMKNILSGHPVSPRPVLAATGFAPIKAKPLIQIPDEATKEYVRQVGLPVMSRPCPLFVPDSHRLKDVFDLLEKHAPMAKLQFWHVMRRLMRPQVEDDEGQADACPACGELTTMRICPICRLKKARQEAEQEAGLQDSG